MDPLTLSASDFLTPVVRSHKANKLEQAMAGVLTSIIQDTQIEQLNDIYSYGVPWRGSKTVVERFTKLNGLVVLRRNDGLSDKLMSVIYANWEAVASERGLSFLQFVLDMLYPAQNTIARLWHSKELADQYPLYITETESEDRFLTSRIRIKISPNVNISELSELVPTLSRLVPWQTVPEVAVNIDTDDSALTVALAAEVVSVVNLSPY